jgi:ATP synthase protein I
MLRGQTIKSDKPVVKPVLKGCLDSGQLTLRHLVIIWLQQFILMIVVTLIVSWIKSKIDYSVLVGGTIYLIPNMYFALYAFRFKGAHAAREMLLSFYRGEMGKFLLSGVGFAVAFTLVKPLDVLMLFSAYIAFTILQWIQLASIK